MYDIANVCRYNTLKVVISLIKNVRELRAKLPNILGLMYLSLDEKR